MMRSKRFIGVALIATFVAAMAVGLLWPQPAQAAPPCDFCDRGEMRCENQCYAQFPNDPQALSECIMDCYTSWDWCFSICY